MKPNTSLMRQAMINIDAAINALAMIHNSGIKQGATAKVLDDMAEIEQMGEQQRG